MLKVFFITVVLMFNFVCSSQADIYTYLDEKGVMHFTNVPTSSKYRVYMKESTAGTFLRGSSSFLRGSVSRFDNIIKSASRKYGVDAALIKAVITAESNFNARAVSSKGAKGLMQIMPFNFSALGISNPFNPTQNIMGGTRYLRQMLELNKGRLKLALASYNAGPHAVKRHKGIPPYRETRDYVVKVIKLYRHYKNG